MPGAGHTMDMLRRLKQNRSIRTSKKAKFKEDRREIQSQENKSKVNFKTVSDIELAEIKFQIQQKAKSENRKSIIVFSVVIVAVTLVFIVLFRNL